MAPSFAPDLRVAVPSKPLYGSLNAWRAALFAALGLGTANGCGGSTEPTPSGVGSDPSSLGSDRTDPDTMPALTPTPSADPQSDATLRPEPEPRYAALSCENPTSFPVLAGTSRETGYVACDGGWYHRSARGECPSSVPRAGTVTGYAGDVCSDSSCTERPHGFCTAIGGIGPGGSVGCAYGCVRDEECGAGQICFCDEPVGLCVPAECQTDADCPDSLCVGTRNRPACGDIDTVFFMCPNPEDECLSPSECEGGLKCELQSLPSADGERHISRRCGVGAMCGRPFLVGGSARQAQTEPRSDWLLSRGTPDASSLTERARKELARHWAQLAQMEHASVAAFARFVLELLAAGAPAELVAAGQRALGDEIEHARLCFGLASAYGGAPLGPAPLSTRGVLDDTGLHASVRAAIHEACVGETLAAAEANAALQGCSDDAVRAVLQTVVRDESAHAELGWKFLQWALASAGPGLRDLARCELQRAIDAALTDGGSLVDRSPAEEAALARHGLCPEPSRRAARRAALEQVVLPLARELLAPAVRVPSYGPPNAVSARRSDSSAWTAT